MDVTLAEPEEVEEITEHNCYNSSNLGFNMVYTSPESTGDAPASLSTISSAASALLVAAIVSMVGAFLA